MQPREGLADQRADQKEAEEEGKRRQAWQKACSVGFWGKMRSPRSRRSARVLAKAPIPLRFIRKGSLFWLALHDGPAPRLHFVPLFTEAMVWVARPDNPPG